VVLYNRMFTRVKAGISKTLRFSSEHRAAIALSLLALLVAGAIAPLVGQQTSRQRTREEERDSATLIRKRAEWFYRQRAYPLGHIPSGARLKAIQQLEQMQRSEGTLMDRFAAQARSTILPQGLITTCSTTPCSWSSIGPEPTSSPEFNLTSGRVNAIAVDPCDTTGDTVYIGGAQGGVWKTTDGGSTWTALTDNQPSLAIGSIALDPVPGDCTGGGPSAGGHTGKIYVGTGEENFSFDSFYGAGVLISTDGSGSPSSWVQNTGANSLMPTNTPQSVTAAGPYIGSLAVDPATSAASGQVLLAAIQGVSTAVHSGIYRSTDGGNTWIKVLPSSSSTFDFGTGVAFDPGDSSGGTAYAALGVPFSGSGEESNNGLWMATNCGSTGSCNNWTRVTNLDNAVNSTLGNGASSAYGRMTIAVTNQTPSSGTGNTTIVVAIADITATSCGQADSSCLLGTFMSTDGGTTFKQVNSGAFCDAQCFYDISIGIDPANPNFIFLGGGPNAGGTSSPLAGVSSVIFSSNGGATFTDVSLDNASGFPIHVDNHAFAFAHPASGPNAGKTIVYVGDDGGVWSSSNAESNPGTQDWSDLNTNLSLTQFYPGNSIHPSNPQVGFAGAQDNGTQKFDRTFNLSNPQETHDVFVCGDGGWTAIDPTTPSTVYAACEDIGQAGIISKNQLDGEPGGSGNTFGQNWLAIDTPAIDTDNANFVPPLVLDPLTPTNLYFGTCRVWQSTSGGISWTDISGGLDGSVAKGSLTTNCPAGSLDITTMAVAPSDSGTVYVGAETPQANGGIISSLFVTTGAENGSTATFSQFDKSGTTPNDRMVTQIAVSPASNKIAYITYSGFSSCGSSNGCDGLGHVFKFDGSTGTNTFTNISGNLPDVPVNDIVIDPNDNTNNTIYVATDVGVFGTTNAQGTGTPCAAGTGVVWCVLANGLPHVECTSLKLDNTARVLRVGTHGRGDWDLQLIGLAASALTGMAPTSATAGGSTFTLTLNGQGFGMNPTVNFGTTTGLPSVGSGSQLQVAVPASAISASGVEAVTVAGASGSLDFSVEGPVPTISGISPTSVSSTANPVTITVSGTNFTSSTGITWTPTSGSQVNNPSFIPQNSGSLSGTSSFTVTVPASLLQTTLSRMVPATPTRRQGPDSPFWFLAAAFAAITGLLFFAFVPRKRRLILGTTLTAVVVLLFVAGCSNSGTPPPPPPNSVQVAVQTYTPGPGGGLSAATASFTVQ
jgi:hypothetical protein